MPRQEPPGLPGSRRSRRQTLWTVAGVVAIVAILLWPRGADADTQALGLCPGERLIGSEYTFPAEPAYVTPQTLEQAVGTYLEAAYEGVLPSWVDITRISAKDSSSMDLSVRENLVPRALLRFEQVFTDRWELVGYLACESWAAARDLTLRATP